MNTRNTIGFIQPNKKEYTANKIHTDQLEDEKLMALIHLSQKIDEMMTNFAKCINREKSFYEHKHKDFHKLLDKFYIKYYEPL